MTSSLACGERKGARKHQKRCVAIGNAFATPHIRSAKIQKSIVYACTRFSIPDSHNLGSASFQLGDEWLEAYWKPRIPKVLKSSLLELFFFSRQQCRYDVERERLSCNCQTSMACCSTNENISLCPCFCFPIGFSLARACGGRLALLYFLVCNLPTYQIVLKIPNQSRPDIKQYFPLS